MKIVAYKVLPPNHKKINFHKILTPTLFLINVINFTVSFACLPEPKKLQLCIDFLTFYFSDGNGSLTLLRTMLSLFFIMGKKLSISKAI